MIWSFINSGSLTGQENMSIDMGNALELIRSLKESTILKPIFRIYAWDRPTLSLGKHQLISRAIEEQCKERSIPIVYRPTGGRAVLHANELTYCITMPCDSMEEARIAYRNIHHFFLKCLNTLSIAGLEFAKGVPSFQEHYQSLESSACFSASARHELTCNGKKLIGSAQRIIDGVLLQHGSLPLDNSYLDIADILSLSSEEAIKLRSTLTNHSTSLAECVGHSCNFSEIASIISDKWKEEPIPSFQTT
jgi:lipoate-protein ligase A